VIEVICFDQELLFYAEILRNAFSQEEPALIKNSLSVASQGESLKLSETRQETLQCTHSRVEKFRQSLVHLAFAEDSNLISISQLIRVREVI